MSNTWQAQLERAINYEFQDVGLARLALTHPSYTSEHAGHNNQRLEYLGDAVLQLVCAEFLYTTRPKEDEGVLTRLRASLVCQDALVLYAQTLGLGAFLLMGKGEERSGGRQKSGPLADAFEALLAAVYLDGGLAAAQNLTVPLLQAAQHHNFLDAKSQLQELLQSQNGEIATYQVQRAGGSDHAPNFEAGVFVGQQLLGVGQGVSKKQAEQAAAQKALKNIQKSTQK